MLTRLIGAIQFLTILPLPEDSVHAAANDLGKSSAFFPLAGLLQGLWLALVFAVFGRVFPHDVAAALTIAALVFSNGGFHLDGLADTADALASRKSRERMIAIMKESTSGPIGVVSIVLIVLLKYLLLKNVLALPGLTLTALILTPVAARWSMVPALFHGESARKDGLGKIFIEQTGAAELLTATGLAAAVGAVLVLLTRQPAASWPMGAVFISLYLFSYAMTRLFAKKFGGLTGDNLGAITEMSEVLVLLILLAGAR